jgi:Siphovirus Gp157
MPTLATLTQQLEALCDEVDDCMDELPAELLERFASAKLSHAQKCDAYVAAIKGLQHNAAYYSARAEQLSKRAKTCERIERAIKDRLVYTINANPNLVFKSTDGDKLAVRNNPESLSLSVPLRSRSFSNVIENVVEMNYPDIPEYLDIAQVPILNTAKVKAFLQSGGELSFAKLETKQHLRVT